MSLFSAAVSAVASVGASISVSVCAAVSYTGQTSHHNSPVSHKVSLDDIAHRGPYFGPSHTGSLGNARSTIFLKPGARSANGAMALHVAHSPMSLTHMIISAKTGNLTKIEPQKGFKQSLTAPSAGQSAGVTTQVEADQNNQKPTVGTPSTSASPAAVVSKKSAIRTGMAGV